MSSMKKKQNFSSETARERTGRANNLLADALFPQLNQIRVQWKHCTSGWNHSGKLLTSRRVQLVFFFTPSVFSVSIQFFFFLLSVICKSCQISGQWQVVGEIPRNLRIAASCFSTTHILIPLCLCDAFSVTIHVQAGWPAATAFS